MTPYNGPAPSGPPKLYRVVCSTLLVETACAITSGNHPQKALNSKQADSTLVGFRFDGIASLLENLERVEFIISRLAKSPDFQNIFGVLVAIRDSLQRTRKLTAAG